MPDPTIQPTNGTPQSSAPAMGSPPSPAPASPSQAGPVMGGGSDFGGGSSSPGGQSGGASLREQFAKRGYDASSFDSDDALLDTIDRQLSETQQPDPGYQEYLSQQESFNQWRAEQQAREQAAAAKAAEPPPNPWAPPPFEQEWMRQVQWDEENQRYVPKTAADFEVARKVNARAQYQQKVDRGFKEDPIQFMDQTYGPKVQALVDAKLKEFQERQQREAQTNQANGQFVQMVQQNAQQLFTYNEHGQETGLTLQGQAFEHYGKEALAMGITDPMRIFAYADRNSKADMHIFAQQAAAAGQQQQTAPTAQQDGGKPRGPDGKFLPAGQNGNGSPPPRNRFIENALGGDHNPNQSSAELQLDGSGAPNFLAMARETMKAKGMTSLHG